MGRRKQDKYECPRCGYDTDKKQNMRHHLYMTRKMCPSTKNPIELSDHVKEYVLEFRKYHTHAVPTLGQTINLNYTYNTIIAGMDAIVKLQQLVDYKGVEVLDFESHVEDIYARTVKRLESNSFKHDFVLKKDDFLNAIDKITKAIENTPSTDETEKIKFLEILNFFYDSKRKRIRIYQADTWGDCLVEQGIKFLVETVVGYYFEAYEKYLLKHLGVYVMGNTMDQRMAVLETSLKDYYHFIACFEIDPYVFDKMDGCIMDDDTLV
jgi:hypothetical protein